MSIKCDHLLMAFVAAMVAGSLACDARSPSSECADDVPEMFGCAQRVGPFEIGDCVSPPPDPPASTSMTTEIVDGALRVELQTVVFRDNNEICGYASQQDTEINLLLQPCILTPEGGVSSGDCWYDALAVEIDGIEVESATGIRVFKRVDRPAGEAPEEPQEIASSAL